MRIILALLAWWWTSSMTSAALRYRIAVRSDNLPEAVRQSDRIGSALGALAFAGVLAASSERVRSALGRAQLPP